MYVCDLSAMLELVVIFANSFGERESVCAMCISHNMVKLAPFK